jgi:putative redox protein
MKITERYTGGMRFEGDDRDARIVMDAKAESGGRAAAPTPKELVLHGLAGCTGMDVAAMLEKRGVPFADFAIEVEAEQTKIHPVVFKDIRITYRMRAPEERRAEIERSIELSETRFCGVSAMLGKTAKIAWALELLPPKAGE